MHGKAATIFYSLASFVMFTALFAMQNSSIPEVSMLQQKIQNDFVVAWQQTVGDQPMFEDFGLVFDSVSEFYQQSAVAGIALVQDQASDRDLVFIYTRAYEQVLMTFHPAPALPVAAVTPEMIPTNFMTEPSIGNIVPEIAPAQLAQEAPAEAGMVSGISQGAVNEVMPWVTMRDNLTGQLYCVALYNGELNKYLGTCRYDYH